MDHYFFICLFLVKQNVNLVNLGEGGLSIGQLSVLTIYIIV